MRIPFFLAVFFMLLGRAYQYIFWDASVRALLWDEGIMTPFVAFLTGQSWADFASNQAVNQYIRWYSISTGILFLLAAISCIFIERGKRGKGHSILLLSASFILFLHSVLDMKDHFYHFAQLIESTIQIGAPVVYVYWKFGKIQERQTLKNILKIGIALTFAAHGLYAMGFYQVPGYFIDMTILSLGISEDNARFLLQVLGWLDILLSIGLFVPALERLTLWYAVVWGLLTAVARIWSGLDVDFFWISVHEYSYQTVFRLCHCLIPLTALYLFEKTKHKISI